MNIRKALMEGQDLTLEEANHLLKEMRQRVKDGEDPEEVLYEEGLELDYFYDLLN
jgi:hypothetical protein